MIDAYADGSTIGPNPSTIGGSYAWCHVVNGERVLEGQGVIPAGWLGMKTISNNVAELVAAVEALEWLERRQQCVLWSDSRVTLTRLNHSDCWSGIPDELRWRALEMRERVFRIKLLAGHPTRRQLATGKGRKGRPVSIHNVWCDRVASETGEAYRYAHRQRGLAR